MFSFEGTLISPAPFDFSLSLAFLSDFSPMKNEQQASGNSLTKAVEIQGKTVAFEVKQNGSIESPKLDFTAYSEKQFDKKDKALIEDRISFFLSLKDDLSAFYKIAEKDKFFKPVINRFYGHKQVKFLTPFEIACWAILGQRIPMAVARKMKDRLVERVGGHITVKGQDYRSFPEPAKLASVPNEKMLEMIPNKKKAEWISGVAAAFCEVDEHWLRTAPYDDVYNWLTDIKGIGEWSANFVLVRGLGRMEKLSSIGSELALDVGIVYKGKEEAATDEEVCQIAQKYGNWMGYWGYYLRIYAEFAYVFKN